MERLGESVSIFRALTEVIGTTMRASRMMMPTVGAFAEVRRPMLREGTKAGFATKDIVMVRNECGPTAGSAPPQRSRREILALER
jgi:hypothetical protein